MTVVFISCYLNHHQLTLCEELKKRCDKFYFIATEPTPRARMSFGYEDINKKYDFVLRIYDGSCGIEEAERHITESDVVIFGSCPDELVEKRMSSNKLSFVYSERFFKKGLWLRFIPSAKRQVTNRIARYKDKELYVLCASAFLPLELVLCGFDEKKCLRWGYFPTVTDYSECPKRSNKQLRILWAGRFLDWKRPETAIKAAAYLRDRGVEFTLDMIGSGDEEERLETLIKSLSLEDRVHLLGSMTPDKVRENMESSDIFLMTSNFREGWGAVLNEAMSTGCAVVASSAAGSTAFLVRDGENGLIYNGRSQSSLNKKLMRLALDRELIKRLSQEAYLTIKNDYNASVAAERFFEFVTSPDRAVSYTDSGPMSRARVIGNGWYKDKLKG